jgi:hypothetical protein
MMQNQAVHLHSRITILSFLAIVLPLQAAAASDRQDIQFGRIIVAQSSMGNTDPSPSQMPPSIPSIPSTPPSSSTIEPPNYTPAPTQPNAPAVVLWGAIAFTADGSWSTAWKESSRAEAEATVLKRCASFGHGGCEVSTVSGEECVGLASFIGNYGGRRWRLSFTAGGTTYPTAQGAAMNRCNSDERTRGRCEFRVVACADGR